MNRKADRSEAEPRSDTRTIRMATPTSRARSSTSDSTASSRPRPISRASTTSMNTPSAQPIQPIRHMSESSHLPSKQQYHSRPLHFTPEEMITCSERQLTDPSHEIAIDPLLQDHITGVQTMSVDRTYTGHPSQTRPVVDHHKSFDTRANQFPVSLNDEQTQDDTGVGETRKKKGSASSIANDQELRRLFAENKHIDLQEVASQVLAHERGPRSEKTKQVFAMNWLNTVCKKSNSSVPRSRVYANYAIRCGTERVPPLNPASFGKLVRIIFAGIQTRRLGMRGESRYHYVDLSLIDQQIEGEGDEQVQAVGDVVEATENLATRRPRSQLPADTAVFPSPNIHFDSHLTGDGIPEPKATAHIYLDAAMPKVHQDRSGPNMVRRPLKFPTQQEPPYAHNEPIELPDLTDYLPEGTDPDASNALVALYRTHCISVIDCFRFCKERMFWHHFTSFHGTLTVPVQKLLAHPNVAPWIRECDWLMYQKMVRFVSPLALQVMPVKVIDTFRNITAKLIHHISNTFQNHPQHVRDAKVGPASIFAALIDRLLRVNATAHAAANMLTNDANRDQMWHDWVHFVKPTGVVESSLPCCGYRRTLQILLLEVGELLGPLRSVSYQGMQQIFVNAQADPGPNYNHISHPELDDSSTSGVLDRWTTFLHDLPSRFPGVDARMLIWCVGEVSSACIRDITMAQALSFGSWWVTKVWVDEMLRWIAEKGGFLESGPISIGMRPQKRTASDAGFANDDDTKARGGSRSRAGVSKTTNGPSHYGSVDARNECHKDYSHLNPQMQPGAYHQAPAMHMNENLPAHSNEAAHPPVNSHLPHHMVKEAEQDQIQSHDDSGIGMDLELPPRNTPIRLADYGGFVAHGGGSDPADVVVC